MEWFYKLKTEVSVLYAQRKRTRNGVIYIVIVTSVFFMSQSSDILQWTVTEWGYCKIPHLYFVVLVFILYMVNIQILCVVAVLFWNLCPCYWLSTWHVIYNYLFFILHPINMNLLQSSSRFFPETIYTLFLLVLYDYIAWSFMN